MNKIIERLERSTDTISIIASHIMPGPEYEALCEVREEIMAVITELKKETVDEKGD
jgi:hypothetical protein